MEEAALKSLLLIVWVKWKLFKYQAKTTTKIAKVGLGYLGGGVVAPVGIKAESQIQRGSYLWGYYWGCQSVGDYGSLENANFSHCCMSLGIF